MKRMHLNPSAIKAQCWHRVCTQNESLSLTPRSLFLCVQSRGQIGMMLRLLCEFTTQKRKKPQNLVPEASTGSGLNTKLTLSSFLENTEIKLKPRDGAGLRKGKRKKKRKPRSLRGVKQGKLAPQRSTLEIHTNEHQDQKPEAG